MATEQEEIEIKVTLLGDTAVGKTCIINKYVEGKFDPGTITSAKPTYSKKYFLQGNKKVSLNIWDTVGQERYLAIGKHFYKESYITCLVYDITSKSTFDNLQNLWYKEIMENGEKEKILAIVGNKADLFVDEEVKEKEARDYAKEINAEFFLTSAKSGDGIDNMFEKLVNLFIEKKMPELLEQIKKEEKEKKQKIKIKNKKDKKKKWCWLF